MAALPAYSQVNDSCPFRGTTKHENPLPLTPPTRGGEFIWLSMSLLPLDGGGQGGGDKAYFQVNGSCQSQTGTT